jgi:phage shock protein C
MNVRRKFRLDRHNGKFMGVCAGIANYFNIDATLVRIGAVVITLLGAAPWTFVLYGLTAWLAKSKSENSRDAEDIRTLRGSTHELQASLRDIDRRMAEVDNYVASSSGRLAREIEELR